jgi:localization factor PodJL
MRAELPWNVAGIPPEAREAARAAARREGLSVGEWLTRRILRSLSGLDEELTTPQGVALDSWGLPQSAASRRDTEEMLARVSRTETESSDLNRRIEEQLRAVGQRLDQAERSQSENNRVMSKTASEINLATREQAQAFDQLTRHMLAMGERLERVERSAGQDGLKEAIKALHQGLSRLADQISQSNTQSATQIGALAGNIDQLAARLEETRAESEGVLVALDQRLAAVENLTQLNYNAFEHARADSEMADAALASRIEAVERLSHSVLASLDQMRANGGDVTALAGRLDGIEQASQDRLASLDQSRSEGADAVAALAARLDGMEQTAQDRLASLHQSHGENADAMAALSVRIEQIEKSGQERPAALEQIRSEIENAGKALEQRLFAVEKSSQVGTNALDHALEKLESQAALRAGDLAEAQKRETQTEVALMRLEENLSRLENKVHDSALDHRLDGIDRSLADIVQRLDHEPGDVLEESVRALTQRIEALDKQHQDLLAELRAGLAQPKPEATPPAEAEAPRAPGIETPSFVAFEPQEVAVAELHDVEAPAEPAAPENPPLVEPAPPFAVEGLPPGFNEADPFAGGFAPDHFAATDPFPPNIFGPPDHETPQDLAGPFEADPVATGENFLTAARRSAQAAAEAEAARASTPFNWRRESKPADPDKPKSRLLVPLVIGLIIAIALAASLVLSQRMKAGNQVPTAATPKPAASPKPALPKPAAPVKTEAVVPPPVDGSPTNVGPANIAPANPAPANPVQASGSQASGNKSGAGETARMAPPLPPLVVPASKPETVAPAAPSTAKAPVKAAGASPSPGDRLARLANEGNATAQTILGLKYLDGQGVTPDVQQAGKWLLKAADQNQAVAQYRLGTMYERGQGTKADMAKAAKWYQAAANLGNRKAMHNLAVAYADGGAGKKDMAEAARWFAKAAALGLSDSQFNLAVLYERGEGVPQSLIDAFKWYAVAAGQGDGESRQRLSVLQTQLSDADRAAAQKAAAAFRTAPLDRAANVPPEMSDLPK